LALIPGEEKKLKIIKNELRKFMGMIPEWVEDKNYLVIGW
jgi:hypothetical protein